MSATRKLALGLLTSGVLLTAYLLTGERKQKTRQFISKRAVNIKKALTTEKPVFDDSEAHYI